MVLGSPPALAGSLEHPGQQPGPPLWTQSADPDFAEGLWPPRRRQGTARSLQVSNSPVAYWLPTAPGCLSSMRTSAPDSRAAAFLERQARARSVPVAAGVRGPRPLACSRTASSPREGRCGHRALTDHPRRGSGGRRPLACSRGPTRGRSGAGPPPTRPVRRRSGRRRPLACSRSTERWGADLVEPIPGAVAEEGVRHGQLHDKKGRSRRTGTGAPERAARAQPAATSSNAAAPGPPPQSRRAGSRQRRLGAGP